MTRVVEFEVDNPSFGNLDIHAEVWMGEQGDPDRFGVPGTPDYEPECTKIIVSDIHGNYPGLDVKTWNDLEQIAVLKAIEEEEDSHNNYDQE